MADTYSRGAAVIKKDKKPQKPEEAPIGTGYAKGAKTAIIDRKKKQKEILDQI